MCCHNVFDCRTYHLRKGKLQLVTDNRPLSSSPGPLIFGLMLGSTLEVEVNLPDQLVKEETGLVHKTKSPMTVHINLWTQPLELGDRLLLCSDGLWAFELEKSDISKYLTEADTPEIAVKWLIEAATVKDMPDNVAVVVCEMRAN